MAESRKRAKARLHACDWGTGAIAQAPPRDNSMGQGNRRDQKKLLVSISPRLQSRPHRQLPDPCRSSPPTAGPLPQGNNFASEMAFNSFGNSANTMGGAAAGGAAGITQGADLEVIQTEVRRMMT